MNYREQADAANAVCAEITGMVRKAFAVQADVSVADSVKQMVAEIEAHLGGIDIHLAVNLPLWRPSPIQTPFLGEQVHIETAADAVRDEVAVVP